ncbi:MAG: biotin synthase BioB [Acidobacteria bacterium]|nr:biotin synthase BioB [Acidobacteriota bacterium]
MVCEAFDPKGISAEEALNLMNLEGAALFEVFARAGRVREHFKGNEVRMCSIVNAKSGGCPENCSFCSQSAHYSGEASRYPLMTPQQVAENARAAAAAHATEFSIVTATRGVNEPKALGQIADSVRAVRDAGLEACASLGLLTENSLQVLKDAGMQHVHHNLETSRSHFDKICTTHTYDDQIETVRSAKKLGFDVCCGGIFGMGETREQRVELAVTLRELDVDHIPMNFLDPRPGTPLADVERLSPTECLKIIAVYRLMMPTKDIFVMGGREVNLRDMQSWIFMAGANGMLLGNYLTTRGRSAEDDLKMLADLGMKIKLPEIKPAPNDTVERPMKLTQLRRATS